MYREQWTPVCQSHPYYQVKEKTGRFCCVCTTSITSLFFLWRVPFAYDWLLHTSHCLCLSYVCGNKMPTRCNRGFYCRSYCFINMFRAPLCPSSGAQEYPVCRMLQHPTNRTHNPQLQTRPATWKPQHEIPQAATTLELLMMGIVVPKTCWASNKICNIKTSVASSWYFISTY